MGSRITAALAASLVLALLAGCARTAPRAIPVQLAHDAARGFKRAYDAEHRMTTGRPEDELITSTWQTCRPLEPDPGDGRAWRWACHLYYVARSPLAWAADRGQASYVVSVDPRGCFSATSADYPDRVYERMLRRRSANPLSHFVTCPFRPAVGID